MSSVISVADFGAVPDGKTLNTAALQAAIDACNAAGGGVVRFDSGSYRTGSLNLRSNVELRLIPGCEIVGSTDLNDYADFVSEGFVTTHVPEGTRKYLIGASHVTNVAITGAGTINASGVSFFDSTALKPNGKFARKPEQRPRLLMMHCCEAVRLLDAAFIDSPCWTFWIMRCERVRIQGITITGDQRMLNNDGIDIDSCRNVMISDCFIKTDDDCLVLRAIQGVHDKPAVCEDIVVNNCVLESTCQCVRISCPSDNVTRRCTFSNLTMRSSSNGINFDFPNRYVRNTTTAGADVHDISFSNIVVEAARHPVRILVEEGVRLTRVADIAFANLNLKGGRPCVVQGNELVTVTNVSFANTRIHITAETALLCSHCRGLQLNDVQIVCEPAAN